MTIGPVVLLGLLSIFFMLTTVRSSMMEEIEEGLKGTAAATLAAYDQNTGDYMESSNGDIWKGSYNISRSESLVDRIRDNTGMDVTFFYGDRRIMTSAVDSNGDRILNSPAGETGSWRRYYRTERKYFSSAVSLDGVMNYGYFMPVYQNGSDDEIIGMVFVGTDKRKQGCGSKRNHFRHRCSSMRGNDPVHRRGAEAGNLYQPQYQEEYQHHG